MSYSSTILADSPFRYYHLNDSTGAITHPTDSSTNNVGGDGILGGPTLQVPGLIVGDADTAITITTDITQYLRLQSGAFILGGQANLSIELWIKGTTTGGGVLALYGEYDSGALDYMSLQTVTSAHTQLAFAYKGHSGSLVTVNSGTGLTLANGSPHHIVVTKAGTAVNIYVDGAQSGTTGTVGANDTFDLTATGVRVGNWFDAAGFGLAGYTIDEVALYTTALSAGAVASHYTAGTGGAPATDPPIADAQTIFFHG